MKSHKKIAVEKAVLRVLQQEDRLEASVKDQLSQTEIVKFANKAVHLAQLRAHRIYDEKTRTEATEYAKSIL